MKFSVNEDVKELGVKVVGFIIEGLDNKSINQEYIDYKVIYYLDYIQKTDIQNHL